MSYMCVCIYIYIYFKKVTKRYLQYAGLKNFQLVSLFFSSSYYRWIWFNRQKFLSNICTQELFVALMPRNKTLFCQGYLASCTPHLLNTIHKFKP